MPFKNRALYIEMIEKKRQSVLPGPQPPQVVHEPEGPNITEVEQIVERQMQNLVKATILIIGASFLMSTASQVIVNNTRPRRIYR